MNYNSSSLPKIIAVLTPKVGFIDGFANVETSLLRKTSISGPFQLKIKGIAKDHSKSLVRSSTCLVILDYFYFTPLVLIGKKIFF